MEKGDKFNFIFSKKENVSVNIAYLVGVVLVSLTQLTGTVHNICKVRGLNPNHHQKSLFGRDNALSRGRAAVFFGKK
jgi:hypothetical protein